MHRHSRKNEKKKKIPLRQGLLVTQRNVLSLPRKEGMAMCAYTTGEVAKECGVTVRTVQYYDARGILCPHTLSEGGRRLYSQEDVQKMKIICFLRELGLSLNDIGQLLEEENPDSVIALLLERQSQILSAEIAQRQEKLKKLDALNRGLKQA